MKVMRTTVLAITLVALPGLPSLCHLPGQPDLPDLLDLPARLLAAPLVKGPDHGALVIVGGGRVGPEILTRFFDLAGGRDAPLVVIPTANGAESYPDDWSGLTVFKDFGVTK